jgi:hypothetical protein
MKPRSSIRTSDGIWRAAVVVLAAATACVTGCGTQAGNLSTSQGDAGVLLGVLGVCLGVASLVVARFASGRNFSLGVIHLSSLAAFHFLIELNLVVFPDGWQYRAIGGFDGSRLGMTLALAGLGMLVFAFGYASGPPLAGGPGKPPALGTAWLSQIDAVTLVAWLACSLILQPSRSNDPRSGTTANYLQSMLFEMISILSILLIVKLFDLSRRVGARTALPLLCSAGILAMVVLLTGQRNQLFPIVVAALYLVHTGRIAELTHRVTLVLLPVILVLIVVVIQIRHFVGRDELSAASPLERMRLSGQAVIEGFGLGSNSESLREAVSGDLGYRLDGNLYLSHLIDDESLNPFATWDLYPIIGCLELTVPSALWSSKNSRMYLNPEQYIVETRRLPDVDYLTTPLADFFSVGGITPMVLGMFLTGLGVKVLERRLTSEPGLFGGVCLACIAYSLIMVEQGIEVWPLRARSAIIIASVLVITCKIKSFRNLPLVRGDTRPSTPPGLDRIDKPARGIGR